MLESENKDKKSILLIDDDKITHFLLQELFIRKEKILCADSGKKGVEILKKYREGVGLIFLDLRLPNESCFKVYREIKHQNPNIPVIAVTAAYIADYKHKCISEGFNEIISKPIDIYELRNTVNKYLD